MRGLDSLSKQLSLDNREQGLVGREEARTSTLEEVNISICWRDTNKMGNQFYQLISEVRLSNC